MSIEYYPCRNQHLVHQKHAQIHHPSYLLTHYLLGYHSNLDRNQCLRSLRLDYYTKTTILYSFYSPMIFKQIDFVDYSPNASTDQANLDYQETVANLNSKNFSGSFLFRSTPKVKTHHHSYFPLTLQIWRYLYSLAMT